MVSVSTGEFVHDGFRLVYDEYGSGARPFVLLPGLLLPRSMHRPLATALAERGNHVIVPDLLGHGDSDRPRDMWRYSMPLFGQQVVGLMDHLAIEEAIVGGTSLGANVTLETCVAVPKRVRGAVVEMPVRDNALLGCALAFTPMLVALTFGEPITRRIASAFRLVPRIPMRDPFGYINVGLDWISQEPGPSAAYLQGLFFGRTAPPRSERSKIDTPALIIGHGRDPVHPFSDSDMLTREMRNSRMIEADSMVELRLTPARLTNEIARFLDECWQPAASQRAASAKSRRAGAAGSR